MAGDRVYPNRVGEVYHLQYDGDQRWYWLSDQNPDEPFVMLMYDTASGTQARCKSTHGLQVPFKLGLFSKTYCPHVSFHNPLASPMAPARESVETRSIVITDSLDL